MKRTGFEKNGLALGKIALRIFRLGTGHHRRVSIIPIEKYGLGALLKSTGSHPLNSLSGNPIKPVLFKRAAVLISTS